MLFARTPRQVLAGMLARVTLLAVLALLLVPSPARAQDDDDDGRPARREEFRWAGQVAPGQAVEVRGINGGIRAEPSSSGQVEIVAVKTGRRSDPRLVKVEVVPHGEGVTICAVYPPVDGEANECVPGGGGRNNSRNNDVRVQFDVRVPQGVNLTARTVNGAVSATGLDGRVDVSTVNGAVTFATEGTGVAKTVNGSITARLGRADWTDTLALETVNGSITLDLPSGTNTDIEARTVNGRIDSSLPVQVTSLSRRVLKGTIGTGGRALSLRTVNGGIVLKTGA